MARDISSAVHYMRGRIAGIEQDVIDLEWKIQSEQNAAALSMLIDEYDEGSKLLDQLRELMRRAGQAKG